MVDELRIDAADEDMQVAAGQLEVADSDRGARRSRSRQDPDRAHARPPGGGAKCALELLDLDEDRLTRSGDRETQAQQKSSLSVERGALDVERKVSGEDSMRPGLVSPAAESAGAADEVTRRLLTEPRER